MNEKERRQLTLEMLKALETKGKKTKKQGILTVLAELERGGLLGGHYAALQWLARNRCFERWCAASGRKFAYYGYESHPNFVEARVLELLLNELGLAPEAAEDTMDLFRVIASAVDIRCAGNLEEPAAEEPVVEVPVTEEPAAEEPVVESPVTEEPAAEEPVVESPVTEEAAAEEPVVESPVTEEPAAEEPAVEPPVTEEAAAENLAAESPAIEEPPVTEEAAVENAVLEEPVLQRPAPKQAVSRRAEPKQHPQERPAPKKTASPAAEAGKSRPKRTRPGRYIVITLPNFRPVRQALGNTGRLLLTKSRDAMAWAEQQKRALQAKQHQKKAQGKQNKKP